uniref:E3 ubiquitin-protein ligase MARCH3 n=1 Tax=Lygus hesperus TaxID=30085 RepID=A0A0A9XQH1_LYGHE
MERSCAIRTNSDVICRICLEERGVEGFISPCDCSGTMGNVHRSCLERWLTLLNSSECEICRHKFKVRRYMRPARQFRLTQLPLDTCGDLICITVLSPLCVLIIYFTVEASVVNIKSGKTSGAVVLIVIATTIILVYLIWVYCTLRHALSFWWGSNRIVRLSTNQVAPARRMLTG